MCAVVVAQIEVNNAAVLVRAVKIRLRAQRIVAVTLIGSRTYVVDYDDDAAARVLDFVAVLVRLDRKLVACSTRRSYALAGPSAVQIL